MKVIRVLWAAWAWCVLPGHVGAAATEAPSRGALLAPASASTAGSGPAAGDAAKPAVPLASGVPSATRPREKGADGTSQPPQGARRAGAAAQERKAQEDMALSMRTQALADCKQTLDLQTDVVGVSRKQTPAMCAGQGGLKISAQAYASFSAGPGASESRADRSWDVTRKPDEAKVKACLQDEDRRQQARLDKAHAQHAACEAHAWERYRQWLKR